MFEVTVESIVARCRASLSGIGRKQLLYAVRRAVTATARLVAADLRADMPKLFDYPTPIAQNAFWVKLARSAQNSTAYVGIKDQATNGGNTA